MTTYAVVTCDGTRNGQPCRGALTLPRDTSRTDEDTYARNAGWRLGPSGELCPSPGHDQDTTP